MECPRLVDEGNDEVFKSLVLGVGIHDLVLESGGTKSWALDFESR
jgi:hypothetical protein